MEWHWQSAVAQAFWCADQPCMATLLGDTEKFQEQGGKRKASNDVLPFKGKDIILIIELCGI